MSKTVVNKVTKVVWDNGFKPDGVNIPSVTSADQGKVLAVDSNGKWVAASPSAPQSELPEYSAADEGKILKVDDQGDLEWAEDDNTQYTAGDNVSIVNGEISAVDTTYTAGDNVAISADNEISSVNTIVFNAKYIRATDTFQYDANAIAPFLAEVFKNDKRAIVRVQDGNYNIFDIYTLKHYESGNNNASFSKVNPIIVSANQREIVCSHIGLAVSNGTGTLTYTNEGVTDLPENATQGQIPISDGNNGWIAGNIPTELPSVTSADEGQVLIVDNNGEWTKGTAPVGAQDAIIVNLRRDTSNNSITITDTTYTTTTQIQTLVTDGKEVILRVEKDSTESFEFFTLSSDNSMTSIRSYMILWNLVSVDSFSTGLTQFSRISLLAGTNFVYENMSANIGGSSYTAGDGINISAQDVISSPEAVMAKESIADNYADGSGAQAFYPVFDDAIASDANMERDCLAAVSTTWNTSMGIRPYDHDHTHNIYMAVIDPGNPNVPPRVMFFVVANAAASVHYQYISSDGSIYQDTNTYAATPFSGTVNSGYSSSSIPINSQATSSYGSLITCAKDLSLCSYPSASAATAAFGAWKIPGNYNEGDQVWKDGKLQTYTNGDWVDSDPLVEQIANAGGGGSTGETWEIIGQETIGIQLKSSENNVYPVSLNSDVDFTKYKKLAIEFIYTSSPAQTTNYRVPNFGEAYPIILYAYPNPNGYGASKPAPFIFENYSIGAIGDGGKVWYVLSPGLAQVTVDGPYTRVYIAAKGSSDTIWISAKMNVYGIY